MSAWRIIAAMTMPQPASLPPFPETATTLLLDGPCGPLQVLAQQAATHARAAATAVICHPHPLQGGTMQNKVVTMLERSLRERGLATVRFNFRGVGESAGAYDDGNGEGDDLAAVVNWVRASRPDDALWLAGFSFGSYVSIRNARRLAADALISVAPGRTLALRGHRPARMPVVGDSGRSGRDCRSVRRPCLDRPTAVAAKPGPAAGYGTLLPRQAAGSAPRTAGRRPALARRRYDLNRGDPAPEPGMRYPVAVMDMFQPPASE